MRCFVHGMAWQVVTERLFVAVPQSTMLPQLATLLPKVTATASAEATETSIKAVVSVTVPLKSHDSLTSGSDATEVSDCEASADEEFPDDEILRVLRRQVRTLNRERRTLLERQRGE